MDSQQEYIDKIKEFRRLGRETREAEQAATENALADFSRLMGGLRSFAEMSTPNFPVDTVEVLNSYEIEEGLYDVGCRVVANRRAGRLDVEMRTHEADIFAQLTVQPGRVRPSRRWVLEVSDRRFDGSESSAKSYFDNAADALRALRTKTLSAVLDIAAKGFKASVPVLPDDDADAATSVRNCVAAAIRAGREIEDRRKQHSAEIAASGLQVAAAWHEVRASLGFLEEIGFTTEAEGEGGISFSEGMSGGIVDINHGEGYSSRLVISAVDDDPSHVSITAEDLNGRKELLLYQDTADKHTLISTIRLAILGEIENAEAAYVPQPENSNDRAPAM